LAKFQPKVCVGCGVTDEMTIRCLCDPAIPAHHYCLKSCHITREKVCCLPRNMCKHFVGCPLIGTRVDIVCKCGTIFCRNCYPVAAFAAGDIKCPHCDLKKKLVEARKQANLHSSIAAAGPVRHFDESLDEYEGRVDEFYRVVRARTFL